MRLLLKASLVACALILIAATAQAQPAKIGLYTDETATACNLLDTGTGLHTVYVIYSGGAQVSAAEFMVTPADGAALTYMGDSFPTGGGGMGNANTGVAVALGGCHSAPVVIATVVYQGLGVSGTCGSVKILPDPRSYYQNGDKIAFVSCAEVIEWATPGYITVNPDENCECDASAGGNPAPVTASTWGGIKALYTD
jgi:hypothetical protein